MNDRQSSAVKRPMNLLGLDYRAEAARLGEPVCPIVDAHTHINGARAARIFADACDRYGVTRTYSQTMLANADDVKDALGERIRFVTIPDFLNENPKHAHTEGFLHDIDEWHARGSRMIKFWCAPRGREYGREVGDPTLLTLDHPSRRRQMDKAASLGMMFMVHIADPDTWFATRYADADFYGTKRSHYEPLERLAKVYDVPWLLAHMGGSPEDLGFLTGLLERNPNFIIDTSACKWMVRELSRHPRDELVAFLKRFKGRILFGSDIVTTDSHLTDEEGPRGMGLKASSEEEAFDLYASRYWAYRTMLETGYEGPSPIADPDLALANPERYDDLSSPTLQGLSLDPAMLKVLYNDAVAHTIDKWHDEH